MMRKIASFFGWVAFWAWLILAACIYFLPYVGVKITYVCLPVGVLGTVIWWFLSPNENQEQSSNDQ
ncbi:hypothetical protein [Conchiformibius steedae]|uniref:Uncharacterized protein n=1 Tax=Conchiformibius steedae TaxID=153493 RepID=A0A3P2ABD9_9NEIS|nr:hypothetical protein [Conchiformibius steedae]RRD90933.1 hypothetical protein EII21_02980 [Conchiformibius steedae]